MTGHPRSTSLASLCASTWASPGSPKASVLPEPVAAVPTMSRPDKMMGQLCAWIGLGAVKSRVTDSTAGLKPDSEKCCAGRREQPETEMRCDERNEETWQERERERERM